MVSWLPACRTPAGMVTYAALTACSSPPTRFHSLLGADTSGVAVFAPAQAPVRTYLIDVVAVHIPPSAAGRRSVVQAGSGQVDVPEMGRWASPAADGIRAALSSGLALQIRAIDLHSFPCDGRRPVCRVAMGAQRFDAWRGSHVLVNTVWTVRTTDNRQLPTCHSIVQESVPAGIDGVAEGHRRALKTLASQMAQALLAYAATPIEVARPMPGRLDSMTSAVGR